MEKAWALLFDPGEGVNPDVCGTCGEEGPGALGGGRAGRKDIVNQQKLFALHAIGPYNDKRSLDVLLSLSSTPTLSLRRPDPPKHTLTNIKTETAPDLPRQQCGLVKASRALSSGMERNRNQRLKLTGIKESSGRLDHQTTQMAGEQRTTTILEQEDGLAHCPAGFV